MKNPRALLLNAIEELVVVWQDGLPSEGVVRARLNETLTAEALDAPPGLSIASLDEIRQNMIDEAVATFKLCCTIVNTR